MRNFLTRRNVESPWGLSIFDEFDDFFKPVFVNRNNGMNTDVKETETGYNVSIDMPGFDKKDISLKLDKGYLTVEANKSEQTENNEGYLRRERSVSCRRSYYVGEAVTEEDIKAKYLNGTLEIDVPKKEKTEPVAKVIKID